MRYLAFPAFLAVSLMLAACADRGGEWPSLARVPGSPTPPCGPAAESAPTGARPCVAAPPVVSAATPDLPALEARLVAARGAWADTMKAAESAVAAAARAEAGESAWAAAELQLSRLERAAVPFAEVAEALAGSESGAALRAAAEADRARHLETFARLRAALRR
ncbi:hypothetical protein [Sphingosinicella microcystinivorans]|nr:hypothetical protein [Sphingosinicella microcystinivorans]